jgi:hypothetical protein
MAKVQFELDDENVTGTLLSAPNAIGVCTVKCYSTEVQRHVNRVRALDDEAKRLLASGDQFVKRNAEQAIDEIEKSPKTAFDGWTIDDVELLRVFVVKRIFEIQGGERKGWRLREYNRLVAATALIKMWIKQSRMGRTSSEAGLTKEQARDPIALLTAARQALVSLTTRMKDLTGEYESTQKEKRLAEAIWNYLAHHAAPTELAAVAESKAKS